MSDLANRLRDYPNNQGHMAMREAAADEIDRLTAEVSDITHRYDRQVLVTKDYIAENKRLSGYIWPLCDVDGCTTRAYFSNPTRCDTHWKQADMVLVKGNEQSLHTWIKYGKDYETYDIG